VTRADRRRLLDGVQSLNREQLADVNDPEIATRIAQYEMAFRMQMSVPELMELKEESAETLALYGAKPGQASFASNCLLARRLVERGVHSCSSFTPIGTRTAILKPAYPPAPRKSISQWRHWFTI